jgi:Spherulation-specific family 4
MRSSMGLTLRSVLVTVLDLSILLIVVPESTNASSATGVLQSRPSAAPVGVIIPLYVSPTSGAWQKVIAEKKQFANVSFVVVVNPDSGVGSSKDAGFATDVTNIQAVGIVVLGYDWTGYGKVSQRDVEGNMTDYRNWYGVNGIFFDGMSSSASTYSYYQTDASFARSLKFTMAVGNPGTGVNPKLYGTFTFINIWETRNLPTATDLRTGEPASQQSYIANNLASFPSTSKLTALNPYVDHLFVTSSVNYGSVPTYFAAEISYLSHS